jgi:hypothetical protein
VLLAYALHDVIRQAVIPGIAYLWWLAGLFYNSIPQLLLWIASTAIVFLVLLESVLPRVFRSRQGCQRPARGPVGCLRNNFRRHRAASI